MLPLQKMVDGQGVEIPLFPDYQLIITQPPHYEYSHQTIEAMDCGGEGVRLYHAPCTLFVKENNDPCDHRVLYWTVKPVHTKDYGIVDLSFMIFHNNDVSDLTVGKVIPQGELAWKSGGQGYKGAYTYPFHSHINIAIGHQDIFENGQLRNSVNPQDVLFINDTEIIQTCGMNFATYIPKEIATMLQIDMLFCPQKDMRIRELPTTDSKVIGLLKSTVEVTVTEKSTNLIDGYIWLKTKDGFVALLDENWLYLKNVEVIETTPILEPVQPQAVSEPVVSDLPIVELVVDETVNNAPQALDEPINETVSVEPVIIVSKPLNLVDLVIKLIEFIVSLFNKK